MKRTSIASITNETKRKGAHWFLLPFRWPICIWNQICTHTHYLCFLLLLLQHTVFDSDVKMVIFTSKNASWSVGASVFPCRSLLYFFFCSSKSPCRHTHSHSHTHLPIFFFFFTISFACGVLRIAERKCCICTVWQQKHPKIYRLTSRI